WSWPKLSSDFHHFQIHPCFQVILTSIFLIYQSVHDIIAHILLYVHNIQIVSQLIELPIR
ncbi:hypothetical protein LINPERHAP1_LOCUS28824, partial [Linum perenne]